MKLLNTPDDMQWLRDVHWPTLPPEYRSAVLHGNEDWPTRIEAYEAIEPLITDTPLILTAEEIDAHHDPAHKRA